MSQFVKPGIYSTGALPKHEAAIRRLEAQIAAGIEGVDWVMLDEKKIKINPDLRSILKRNPGWYINGTKGIHHRLVHDDHPGKWVTAAKTPSDRRSYNNVEADMKSIVAGRPTSQTAQNLDAKSSTPRADSLINSNLSKRKQKALRKKQGG